MISRRSFLSLAGSSFAALSVYPSCSLSGESTIDEDVLLLRPQNTEFQRFSTPFNKRIKTKPKLIAVCHNEVGVQKAVQLAHLENLVIAVKSGAHSFEGFSLNGEGMVIDVSLMQSQRLEGGTYITGPGVRLAQTYDYLLPRERLVPVGSCGTVGLSGLCLGGGYGMFSRRWGLTCDSLTAVRMVDGQGQVRDSREDRELLWACRGGGNGNFGVVTQLHLETQSAPEFLPRHRMKFRKLNARKAVGLCERWFTETARLPNDAFSAFVLNGDTLTLLITYFDKHSVGAVRAIAASLAQGASIVAPPANERIAKAVTRYYGVKHPLHFKNVSAGYYRGFDDLRGGIEDIFAAVIASKGVIFQINTLGGAVSDGEKMSGAAYPHREYSYLGEMQSYWNHDAETESRVNQVATFQMQLRAMGIKHHYRNYPGLELRDWESAYYGEANYERLQRCKKKYDPHDRVSHAQSVRLPE